MSETVSTMGNVAYLARYAFDEQQCTRGGLLVIDAHGKPLEFRCTSPVRANTVQKVLYGKSLDAHIAVEVVGKPILASARAPFLFVLVNDPDFLGLRETKEYPLLYVRAQGAAFKGRGDAKVDGVLVSSENGRFQPIVLEPSDGYASDVQEAQKILTEMATRMDLVEPFERIQRALEDIHKQKKGE